MHIVIPDDYQDAVRHLDCFARLAGHDVTIFNDTVKDVASLASRFADADAIVLTRERTAIRRELLERLPRLRLISQAGKIASHVDLDAATARGIAVADGRGGGVSTAELTWALLLASRRHLMQEVNRLKSGLWQGAIGEELFGRRLGIWGYGRIGRQIARYGIAFGMRVWIWGRAGSIARAAEDGVQTAPSRQDFLAQSDVVSLQVRLSQETRGLVTADDLALMHPRSLLINTGRAELIAPGALVAALRLGRPGFAAIDVYEDEPVLGASNPLLQLPNALCTPHIGYVARDSYENYFGIAFDNINRFAAGDPVNIVNPEALRVPPRHA